ncbi:MAG: DNA-directed DNA polymerase II small subunit [archaeon]
MNPKKEILLKFLGHNIQVSKDALDALLADKNPTEKADEVLTRIKGKEKLLLVAHLKKSTRQCQAEVKVLKTYSGNTPISNAQDISAFFTSRYNHFKKVFHGRLNNLVSLSHLKKLNNEKASTIAMVSSKTTTPKGNIILELEDPTGVFKAIATSEDAIKKATAVIRDEVIGVSGSTGTDILFIDDIVWPEVPIKNVRKETSETIYAAFLSDTHIGSKKFMRQEFKKLLQWFNSDNEIAKNTRYVFLAGDIVEGVGVYPKQEAELEYTDIREQYKQAAMLLSKLPEHMHLIISPGNHDFVRLAQPQPALCPEICAPLYALKNTTMVSNPSLVNIHGFDNGGINVLMYHGVSIDAMVSATPLLKDGYAHPEKVMLSLLKRRHLSPPYESGLIAGGIDSLVIDETPDVFHVGHVHSNGAAEYRGITLINSGTWQAQTDFQKLVGHDPTPAQLPVLNLKTRELSLINFISK